MFLLLTPDVHRPPPQSPALTDQLRLKSIDPPASRELIYHQGLTEVVGAAMLSIIRALRLCFGTDLLFFPHAWIVKHTDRRKSRVREVSRASRRLIVDRSQDLWYNMLKEKTYSTASLCI